jgi:23S rRNA (uracil1939-C5)-methyltransferase
MQHEIAENAEAIDTGESGNAVVRHNERIIFVKGLVPGDIADIKIVKKKKKYALGKIITIKTLSPLRVKPACKHFGTCGGCSWQNLDYEQQIAFKQKHVEDAFERIGHIAVGEKLPIVRSENVFHYRNKLEFTFSAKRWLTYEEMPAASADGNDTSNFNQPGLGFHIPGLFDKILDIQECHLQPDPSNAIRNEVREFTAKENMPYFNLNAQEGFLRNIMIRNTTTGELMVVVVFCRDDKKMRDTLMKHIAEKFPQITSLQYIINAKKNDSFSDLPSVTYSGTEYITEHLIKKNGDILKFRISPQSFFQTNTSQANALYQKVSELAGLKGNEIVYDLYTGCGTIASFLASEAKSVVGIEYVEQAVTDAKVNAKLNAISNVEFFAGDMQKMLTEEFCRHNGIPSVIITDPPRMGMHPDVVAAILKMAPEKIVYVSCNASTQARDIALMKDKYTVTIIQPFDMFPHTSHVENIALLIKISN